MNKVVEPVATATLKRAAWEGGKCRVPMWSFDGTPAGLCGEPALGEQLPPEAFHALRGYRRDMPYCFGPCCTKHGGPSPDDPRLFQDGLTPDGRAMWCAVMPDFENLQESPAGFSGDPARAIAELRVAILKATSSSSPKGGS